MKFRALPLDDVLIGREDQCWRWLGSHDRAGYALQPRRERGRAHYRVHRLVYELIHGRLPKTMSVHHVCEHKWCINPAHLEAVNGADHGVRHRRCEHGPEHRRKRKRGTYCEACRKAIHEEKFANDAEYRERVRSKGRKSERRRRALREEREAA